MQPVYANLLPNRCQMNRKFLAVALATSTFCAALGLVTSPAEAQWRRDHGYRHGHYYRGVGPGAIVGGALLGLGVGALLAAPYAAPPPVVYSPPPVVYAPPPPAYYPPPAYAYAPVYPPPAYYRPY